MARENDVLLYDRKARMRTGVIVGSAVRQGGSEFGYLRRR
jgi:hypothetical protein